MTDKQRVSGIVEYVDGPKPPHGTYSFKLNNTRYGTYKTPPGVKPGDSITFTASEKGGYWNADVKSIAVAQGDTNSGAVSANTGMGSKTSGSSYDSRQDAITYQAARKDALTFLTLLQEAGALDLGKAKTKAAMIEVVETYVDKYTERFVEDTKNLGHKVEVDTATSGSADEFNDSIPFG